MKKILTATGATVLIFLLGAAIAGGYPTGKTDKYRTGCGPCHGSQPGPAGKIEVQAPAHMQAGITGTFYVALVAAPPGPIGGINAAVTDQYGNEMDGLAADQNTKVMTGGQGKPQITHKSIDEPLGLRLSAGRAWSFTWTPPADTPEGEYTLYIAANAANGDGRANFDLMPAGAGDAWYTHELKIHVHGAGG